MATETMDAAVPAIRDADLVTLQALLPHLATKADIADLRTEVHAAINALTWKLAGALLAGLTALAGLIVALQIFT